MSARVAGLLRELAPQALTAVLRYGADFGAAEDAVQEALLAAAVRWPAEGVPDNPRGWLVRVASRRYLDWRRREATRCAKEAEAADLLRPVEVDDSDELTLLFLCCHPALARPARVALTLRAVGGLTTEEIARAFLVPERTMAQRITRAKRQVATGGLRFTPPPPEEFAGRMDTVLEVLYLVFNEGYAASSGAEVHRAALTGEAIRLTRQLHRLAPGNAEVTGLLALMLLVDARREAREEGGRLVPLREQDRSRWDAGRIAEGVALVESALRDGVVGPYQVQAAIAALHDEAARAEDTDWVQIAGLYELLERLSPGPVVRLNRAVAVAMADGPHAGLALLARLDDSRLAHHHRLAAVRAHLVELTGDHATAVELYRAAARATASVPEREYLLDRAHRLTRG
ncbi:sigma-70 family RNA polymerase sigma factor [Saccharothrix sp. NPDC042600]|uniref:RNA polymerase sigma factor n=1 Tax=Saccharothrix TaxID=2071 RepID=UPI003404744F|nr:sigma factor-like helix-turn-helix DNA-binding protein [Saccharothrix mutabilis subsp. capreolus]